MPQLPRQVPPGEIPTTPVPLRSALGGQVIGSMATDFRRLYGSPTVSPVYTIR